MRRLIAFILVTVTVMMCMCHIVSANTVESSDILDNSSDETYESLGSGAINFTSSYSNDAKRIEISGNVNYNVLVTYGKYTLEVLRILPNQSIKAAVTADEPDIVARMDISARFAMSFEVKTAIHRFSQYAIVLRSPDGELLLASAPQYIGVSSKYSYQNAEGSEFKGIMPSSYAEVSVSGDLGFGSAIIPVYYNRLVNESKNGYMFSHEDTHYFFDKTYIDELDAKIRTYSASGARVYLQLLMPSNTQKATNSYEMPDVYNAETVANIYTYVRFLVSRYNSYVDGQIGGLIVGRQIDTVTGNYNGGLSVDEYAKKYAFYLAVVANTARLENPDIDIVIPISNRDSYSVSANVPSEGYSSSVLVENILSSLDEFFATGLNCSIMLESSTVPVGIAVQENDGAENTYFYEAIPEGSDVIGVNNIALFDSFFSALRGKYRSAPKSYIYCWQVPKELYGTALECSYAYSYYTLSSNSRVSSFVVSFSNVETGVAEAVGRTIKYIDTANGNEQCSKLLAYFGVDSWSDLVRGYSERTHIIRNLYFSKNETLKNQKWKGSFSFFDFSTGDISDWYGASYSQSLRSDYGEGGQRVLRQTVGRSMGAAHSDLLCLNEYDEVLSYTPALKFKLEITDGEISTGAVYELTVTVGIKGSSVSESCLVRSGEICELWLDVDRYSRDNKASYIKISSRSVSGDPDEYSVWLYDVVGYSNIYDSQHLSSLINAERQNIRNQSNSNDDKSTENAIYWVVFSIILGAIFMGGILIMIFRRDDRESSVRQKNKK